MARNSIKVQSTGGGIDDAVFRIMQAFGVTENNPRFPGEHHLKGHSFTGPGTNIEKRLNLPDSDPGKYPVKTRGPIHEKIDTSARKHDIAYNTANKELKAGDIDKKEFIEDIHMADDEFIDDLAKIPGFSLIKSTAAKAILLKKWGEKIGILDKTKFSQTGTGMRDAVDMGYLYPNHYTLKQRNGQNGGFAILPFLVPIISSLAAEGLTALFKHLTKKKEKTGGGGDIDEDDMKKYIIHKLDNMNPKQQIDAVHKAVIM